MERERFFKTINTGIAVAVVLLTMDWLAGTGLNLYNLLT